ncbi:MAG TPA: hypothetical protein VML01_06995 [Bryobacterales bacterium]|nr:hypothetical protein [Bryobacterales bacterium]
MSEIRSNGTPGHEQSDVHPRPIAAFEVGLLVWMVISAALMAGLFYYFTGREAKRDTGGSPLAEAREVAPGPRLQTTPSDEVEQQRASDEERLNSYGWVSEAQGVVRIPIERAMDIVAERGLPTRENVKAGAQ